MKFFSQFSLSIFVLFILIIGLFKKVKVYDSFLKGSEECLKSSLKIFCPLVGLMVAINIFKSSGLLQFLINLISPLTRFLNIPGQILPLAILKPISGSASLATLSDIFKEYGPDSLIGKTASVVASSTETTFYVITIYFASTPVSNTRHIIKCAILTEIVGILTSIYVSKLLF